MTDPANPQASPSRPKELWVIVVLWGIFALLGFATLDFRNNFGNQIGRPIGYALLMFEVLRFVWRGRNWARIILLILSVGSIIVPILVWGGYPLFKCISSGGFLLGAFTVIWMNLKPAREFLRGEKNRQIDRKEYWAKVGSYILLVVLLLQWIMGFALMYWWVIYGSEDWERTKIELRTKGEKLTFRELVPSPPPDGENFFADPMWRQLSDYVSVKNGDQVVQEPRTPEGKWIIKQPFIPLSPTELDAIKKFTPRNVPPVKMRAEATRFLWIKLTETKDPAQRTEIAKTILELTAPTDSLFGRISELLKRPSAYFPLQYEKNFSTPIPHVSQMLVLGQTLGARSLAELVLGEANQAKADVLMILGLSKALKDEPILIVMLVRESLVAIAMISIDKGIELHRWSAEDLIDLENHLEQIQLMKDLPFALRGERANAYAFLKSLTTTANWIRKPKDVISPDNMNFINSVIQPALETMEGSDSIGWNIKTLLFPGLAEFESNRIEQMFRLYATLLLPHLEGSARKTAENQCKVNQAIIACALERYRLAHGSYPATLEVLAPDYLAKLPNSPITGKPMNYSLQTDGTFTLWTPGWNLKSLNGKLGEYSGDGDIVWNQPLASELNNQIKHTP